MYDAMPETSSCVSETRPDHSVVEQRGDNNYFQWNNEVRNSVGSKSYEDQSKISEDEKLEVSKKTSMSKDANLGSAECERGNDDLTQESRMKQDKSCFIGGIALSEEVHFATGSSYEGTWDALGMSGVGKYVLPNGTIYEGEMRDGMFHGHGSLYWSENQRLDVVHRRGELIEHKYTFHDGLHYEEENWNYCVFPDRRFYESIKKGLRPAGRTLKTARQPATILPAGCYDTGDGVFDPITQRITSYTDFNKVLRLPTGDEYEWIVRKCRESRSEPTGYRPDLNENWSENPPKLPYNLPMSHDSPDDWWKRLTTFARDRNFLDAQSDKDRSTNYNDTPILPEVCTCGQIVIIGKPCDCFADYVSSEAEEYEISETTLSEEFSSENRESKRVCLSRASSLRNPPASINNESSSGDIPEKSYISHKIKEAQNVKVFHIDVDSASNIRDEISKNSYGPESGKKSHENKSVGQRLKIGEKSDFDSEAMAETPKERVGKEKSGKSRDFIRDADDVKSERKTRVNTASDGAMANYSMETFNEKRNKENTLRKHAIGEETSRNLDEKSQQQKNDGAEESRPEIVRHKYIDERRKGNVRLSKHEDYTADSIPREKVAGEPETSRDRRSETKLLQENVSEEHLDYESIETELPNDIQQIHSNKEIDEIIEYPTDLHTNKSEDKEQTSNRTHTEFIRNETPMSKSQKTFERNSQSRSEQILDENVISGAVLNEKQSTGAANSIAKKKSKSSLGKDVSGEIAKNRTHESLVRQKTEILHPDTQETEQAGRESLTKFIPVNKTTAPFEKISNNNAQVIAKTSTEGNLRSSNSTEEKPQVSVAKLEKQRTVASHSADGEKSSSAVAFAKLRNLERSNSSKDDPPSLEKVHPSLATVVSVKQEPSQGTNIIEIYKKRSKEKKRENKPMNSNVWRLSSATQNYGPNTKIENLLFHPALTAPRSYDVEYVKKPCDHRVCKTAPREVRTIASHTRKEHPLNAARKPFRSSDGRIVSENE